MGSRKLSSLHARLMQDIVAHIRQQGFAEGDKLREQALADMLRVSRTPIRRVLDHLSGLGLLAKKPNHGYAVIGDPRSWHDAEIELPQALDDDLYERIVAARFAGGLASEFGEADLTQFGAGRDARQRVLARLLAEGLIRRLGKAYEFLPSILDPEAYRESYYYRQALEVAALKAPTFRADNALIGDLRERHYQLLYADVATIKTTHIVEIGSAFHELIARLSGNRFLLAAVQAQNRLRHAVQHTIQYDREQIVRSLTEHLAILDAIEAGQIDHAALLLARHLDPANRRKPEIWSSGP